MGSIMSSKPKPVLVNNRLTLSHPRPARGFLSCRVLFCAAQGEAYRNNKDRAVVRITSP